MSMPVIERRVFEGAAFPGGLERRIWVGTTEADVDNSDTPIFHSMFDEEFEHEETLLPK